jgi:hypothetical protein
MYESLLASPINPHTNEALPVAFQTQIRSHLDILRRLGISPSNPIPITVAVDSLSKSDEVSGTESQFIVDTIFQSARVSGIEPDAVKKLKAIQLNEVLATIGMDQPSLLLLDTDRKRYVMTASHQLITFARAAYTAIKDQPDQAKVFFTNLRLQT